MYRFIEIGGVLMYTIYISGGFALNTFRTIKTINEIKDDLEKVIGNELLVFNEDNFNKIKGKLKKHYLSPKCANEIEKFNLYEVCPKPGFKTAWCTNVLSILKNSGIDYIISIEKSNIFHEDPKGKYDKMLYQVIKHNDDDILEVTIDNIEKYINNDNVGVSLDYDTNTLYKSFINIRINEPEKINLNNLDEYNNKHQLGLSIEDINTLKKIANREYYTDVELYDISQSNNEHCRHWLFKGRLVDIIGMNIDKVSLFDLIKQPYLNPKSPKTVENSLIAFNDNASAIKGHDVNQLIFTGIGGIHHNNNDNNYCKIIKLKTHYTFKAETHNFPSAISPFPAAETGVGGRIRDTICIGRGGINIAGTAGYCVGINDSNSLLLSPDKILIQSSDGASEYGNKIGEPIIGGFTRSFGALIESQYWEWAKPIMFSGGIGHIYELNANANRSSASASSIQSCFKKQVKPGMSIIKIGGDAFTIGLGGSSSSSEENADQNKSNSYENAVQRGDPEVENKVTRVIRNVLSHAIMNDNVNIIKSIHDQGAGGMGNVIKELIEPYGADIDLGKVNLGDSGMSSKDIWSAEYQEQIALLIDENEYPDSYYILENICKRERVEIRKIGTVREDTLLNVIDSRCDNQDEKVISLDLSHLSPITDKTLTYYAELNSFGNISSSSSSYVENIDYAQLYDIKNFKYLLQKVLGTLSVSSKRFLTNKVDRSVTGLIGQQQTIGYLQTPLSNYSAVMASYFAKNGVASSIGEKPLLAFQSPECSARMAVGECLTNLMGIHISNFNNIKLAANWMWPAKADAEEKGHLYKAVKAISTLLKDDLHICIDGGKDSVSMSASLKNGVVVKSPRTVVISAYCDFNNIHNKVTPELKSKNGNSTLIFVDLGYGYSRMGGSIAHQVFNRFDEDNRANIPCPDFIYPRFFPNIFNLMQKYIYKKDIIALHDRSDGGLIATLCEMAIASDIGINCNIKTVKTNNTENRNSNSNSINEALEYFFNEELGLVIEVPNDDIANNIINSFNKEIGNIPIYIIGYTTGYDSNTINIRYNDMAILNDMDLCEIRRQWELTSHIYEIVKIGTNLAKSEMDNYLICKDQAHIRELMRFKYPEKVVKKLIEQYEMIDRSIMQYRYTIGILREEGSNGDREMTAAFYAAGFNVIDIMMSDLVADPKLLNRGYNDKIEDKIRGLAFVGGFSYSDSLGSAQGWFNVIDKNPEISKEIGIFFRRPDTFSLGICNGFQLMVKLGIFNTKTVNYKLIANDSKRFESRFLTVGIETNHNSIMLQDMDGLKIGIWSAHGEGKLIYEYNRTTNINDLKFSSSPIKYAESCYPYNPNGSYHDSAALCSANGRHLGIMPHPERCFLNWQMPYISNIHEKNLNTSKYIYSPWFLMFANAYKWCENNK